MAQNFREVKCTAEVTFKVFSDRDLTDEQLQKELVLMEVEVNERTGNIQMPGRGLRVGARLHLKGVEIVK